MPVFRYNAINESGEPVVGSIEAEHTDAARERLAEQGLRVESLEEQEPTDEAASWLEAEDFDRDREASSPLLFGELSHNGVSVEAALRAFSEEAPSRRLRSALRQVIDLLERGESLQNALRVQRGHWPDDLAAVIDTGVRSGKLAAALEHYIEASRERAELRRNVQQALFYPVVIALFAVFFCVCVLVFIVPSFTSIFEGFGTELPGLTVLVIDLSRFVVESGWIVLLICGGLALATYLLFKRLIQIDGSAGIERVRRAGTWRQLVCQLPLVGPIVRLAAISTYCRMLALLLESETPLPEALSLAGRSSGDASLLFGSLQLAESIDTGESLYEAALPLTQFPPPVVSIFRWTHHPRLFHELLWSMGKKCNVQSRIRATLLKLALEPVSVVMVAGFVGFAVIALFMPLVKLLNDLS